jgi:hypothetical protein
MITKQIVQVVKIHLQFVLLLHVLDCEMSIYDDYSEETLHMTQRTIQKRHPLYCKLFFSLKLKMVNDTV